MSAGLKLPLAIACVFIWIGFVCAISFFEAWLKFRAPGVTPSIGVGIGKLIFTALNKIEWVFALIIGGCLFANTKQFSTGSSIFFLVALCILILQTVSLLPALNVHASQYILGQHEPSSTLHVWFVVVEIVKVLSLFITGVFLLHNHT